MLECRLQEALGLVTADGKRQQQTTGSAWPQAVSGLPREAVAGGCCAKAARLRWRSAPAVMARWLAPGSPFSAHSSWADPGGDRGRPIGRWRERSQRSRRGPRLSAPRMRYVTGAWSRIASKEHGIQPTRLGAAYKTPRPFSPAVPADQSHKKNKTSIELLLSLPSRDEPTQLHQQACPEL